MELKLNFEGYEGHVIMKVAGNAKRNKVLGKLGMTVLDAQNKDEATSKFNSLETIGSLIELSEPFYKEVSLKKDDKSYSSFEDLDFDSDCQEVQLDCATKAILGLGGEDGKK